METVKIDNVVIAKNACKIRHILHGRSVVLVGIMGVGKSSIGKRLALYLGLPFVDSDKEIEIAARMPISDIFTNYGEDYFRLGEKKVMQRLLGGEQKVLATGGGAFLDSETRDMIKQKAISIWLTADVETLSKRIKSRGSRPLLASVDAKKTLAQLLNKRKSIYAKADLKIESRTVAKDIIAGELIDELAKLAPKIAKQRGWQ